MRIAMLTVGTLALLAGVVWTNQDLGSNAFYVSMSFDDKGTLYLTDARSNRVHAVAVKERSARVKAIEVRDLGERIGKMMNASGRLNFTAMAIHPKSKSVWLAAEADRSQRTTLFRIAKGKITEVDLSKLKPTTVTLPRDIQPLDMALTKSGLVVSSMSRDRTFKSSLHRIPLPLKDGSFDGQECEIFHVSQRRWTTNAPLTKMTPTTIAGKSFIIGATACTPVVRIAVDDIGKGKVKTTTIVELGSGNSPVDMLAYPKGLLVTSRNKETYRVATSCLAETGKINEKVTRRGRGVDVLRDLASVSQTALLDGKALVIVKDGALLTVRLP